jgi:hypothetical protein
MKGVKKKVIHCLSEIVLSAGNDRIAVTALMTRPCFCLLEVSELAILAHFFSKSPAYEYESVINSNA